VPTKDALHRRRVITISDLLVKAENEDWHGVADAAMDLRELDATLKAYEQALNPIGAYPPPLVAGQLSQPTTATTTSGLINPEYDKWAKRLG
jgi:hypothetical protein